MTTASPNYDRSQLIDPMPHSEVEGTYPNPETFIKAEVQRIILEMQFRLQSNDEAIVGYFQNQLRQVSSVINGLAGGAELQTALETLQRLRDIVDADGNGILDALGPINAILSTLQSTQGELQSRQAILQSTQESLQTNQQSIQRALGQALRIDAELQAEARKNKDAVQAVANNLARNMQAIRNAFESVEVAFTPIALPEPVFSVTNISPDAGSMDPSIV